jgi:hypothetical protein
MWYRVEIAKDGAVRSCALVEKRGTDSGSTIVYVDADSDAKAVEYAIEWRKAFLLQARKNKARNREVRISKGQCVDCIRDAMPSSQRCRSCQDRCNERKRELRAGDLRLKPGPRPGTEQRTGERIRLEVLKQVQERQSRMSSKQLERWLSNEIILCENRLGIKTPKHEAM